MSVMASVHPFPVIRTVSSSTTFQTCRLPLAPRASTPYSHVLALGIRIPFPDSQIRIHCCRFRQAARKFSSSRRSFRIDQAAQHDHQNPESGDLQSTPGKSSDHSNDDEATCPPPTGPNVGRVATLVFSVVLSTALTSNAAYAVSANQLSSQTRAPLTAPPTTSAPPPRSRPKSAPAGANSSKTPGTTGAPAGTTGGVASLAEKEVAPAEAPADPPAKKIAVGTKGGYSGGGGGGGGVGEKAKKVKKVAPVMGFEERKEYTSNLPSVYETIPYTEILELQRGGDLKHVIKLAAGNSQVIPEKVLVVYQDNRVVRAILPVKSRDLRFWAEWESQNVGDAVIEAFTPPPPPPEVEEWGRWGPSLKWISDLVVRGKSTRAAKGAAKGGGVAAKVKVAKRQLNAEEREAIALLQQVEKLERERKEVERGRVEREQVGKIERQARQKKEKEERVLRQKEAKEAEARLEREAKEAERRATQSEKWEEEDASRELKAQQAVLSEERWSEFWKSTAKNESLQFGLGIAFMFIFYFGIVVNIKKRKKDFDDRVKLQQAADEERRKMLQLEEEAEEMEILTLAELKGELGEEEVRKLKEKEESNPFLKASRNFMRSGANRKIRTGKRKAVSEYMDLDSDVKFTDVAGLGEIRLELEEVVDFFRFAEKYRRRGSKVPSGILLCGDPGTGKTLLAKAVAGEAGVNFFSISASQFVEIYVGVGASRVRALYNEARASAPAVVFIDELDAVGRQRGLTPGSGGQERDNTLNQLLTCLDGFEGSGDVITIAATNRLDVLDTALVRPGRFDRKIFVPKPSVRGRAEILEVHCNRKPRAYDIDFWSVAEVTDGMSGAQLANVVEMAALRVLREGGTEISTDDLLEAAQLEEGGHPNPDNRTALKTRQLALNEAAMVVTALHFPQLSNIQRVTVVPRVQEEKGSTRFKMDVSKMQIDSITRHDLTGFITCHLAAMVADRMWNKEGEVCTIWADSVNVARTTARHLVMQGMAGDERFYGVYDSMQRGGTVEDIDEEAERILEGCRQKAEMILTKNRSLVNALMEELVEKKTLTAAQLQPLVEAYGHIEPPPPQAVEVRSGRLAEFRAKLEADLRGRRKEVGEGEWGREFGVGGVVGGEGEGVPVERGWREEVGNGGRRES